MLHSGSLNCWTFIVCWVLESICIFGYNLWNFQEILSPYQGSQNQLMPFFKKLHRAAILNLKMAAILCIFGHIIMFLFWSLGHDGIRGILKTSESGINLFGRLVVLILCMFPLKQLGCIVGNRHFSKWPPLKTHLPQSCPLKPVETWFWYLNPCFQCQCD